MQFLLNQEEYKGLIERPTKEQMIAHKDVIVLARGLLLQAAGFNCIHNGDSNDYCDHCPTQATHDERGEFFCTMSTHWSK